VSNVHCLTHLLIRLKNCKHKLSCGWMCFELFLDGWMTTSPIHTLVFTLWLIVVDPCLISRNHSFQEMVTFSTTAINKPFADVQTFLFVQFCELFWDPTCTDFMEGMPVVDTLIGWTIINLQLVCHFTNSNPSVLQDHAIDSFHVCNSNGCGLASSSFPMIKPCATIFETLDPFTDNPLRHDTVPILHWHNSIHFGTWYTFRPQKWTTALCSSLEQIKLECPCLWHKTRDRNELSRSHLHHNDRRGVDYMYLVMPNHSHLQNMYLRCG
jgi:hypothetical protein